MAKMCESFWIFWLWTLFETIPCFFLNYLNIDQIDDIMNYTHIIYLNTDSVAV